MDHSGAAADPRDVGRTGALVEGRALAPCSSAGGGVLYSRGRRRAGCICRGYRYPGRGNPGRQGRARLESSRNLGTHRCDRDRARPTPAAARADLVSASARVLQDFTTGSRGPVSRPGRRMVRSTSPLTMPQNMMRWPWSGCRRGARDLLRRLSRLACTGRRRTRCAAVAAWNAAGEQATARRPRESSARRTPRSSARCGERAARMPSWFALPAVCPVNFTSCGVPQRPAATTSSTALVHGLRDCRRARREDGGAGPRGSSCWSAMAAT